jgi:guanyl-specific ribonuclease Sa
MKDKAARTEHLKDENHKIRVAEFDAAAKKTETAVTTTPAAPAVTTETTPAPAADPVPAAAAVPSESGDAVTPVESSSPVKETVPAAAPVTPGAVTPKKDCNCNHAAA